MMITQQHEFTTNTDMTSTPGLIIVEIRAIITSY